MFAIMVRSERNFENSLLIEQVYSRHARTFPCCSCTQKPSVAGVGHSLLHLRCPAPCTFGGCTYTYYRCIPCFPFACLVALSHPALLRRAEQIDERAQSTPVPKFSKTQNDEKTVGLILDQRTMPRWPRIKYLYFAPSARRLLSPKPR